VARWSSAFPTRPVAGPRHVSVFYTEDLVKSAVRTFVWRRGFASQKGLWAAEAAMLVFLGWLLWNGERGWLAGVAGVTVLLPPILVAAMWFIHHRNTVGKFRAMPSRSAELVFGDKTLEIRSELGEAKFPWSAITEVWELPGYWVLFTAPAQFMTLPLQTVSPDDLQFAKSRLAASRSQKS